MCAPKAKTKARSKRVRPETNSKPASVDDEPLKKAKERAPSEVRAEPLVCEVVNKPLVAAAPMVSAPDFNAPPGGSHVVVEREEQKSNRSNVPAIPSGDEAECVDDNNSVETSPLMRPNTGAISPMDVAAEPTHVPHSVVAGRSDSADQSGAEVEPEQNIGSEVEFVAEEPPARFAVDVPHFPNHPKGGNALQVDVVGYVSKAEVYVVKDSVDGQLMLMPRSAFKKEAILPCKILSHVNLDGFDHHVGCDVLFRYDNGITNVKKRSVAGEQRTAKVLHHVLDGDIQWYVVHVPSDDDPSNPDNWYCAYDVCTTEDGWKLAAMPVY